MNLYRRIQRNILCRIGCHVAGTPWGMHGYFCAECGRWYQDQ